MVLARDLGIFVRGKIKSEGDCIPGLASFFELILALEGIINLLRKSFSGSEASREAAYSFVAAFSG